MCATESRTSPIKGIVRQVAATTKGRFRTVGGASTTTAVTKGAAFLTIDRCTGTRDRGRARQREGLDRRLRRTVTVTAGSAYMAKAQAVPDEEGPAELA